MKAETKYTNGDEVFIFDGHTILIGKICNAYAWIHETCFFVLYSVRVQVAGLSEGNVKVFDRQETEVFKSAAELTTYLLSNIKSTYKEQRNIYTVKKFEGEV